MPGRHHVAQGALEFSKAGGAFYWVNGVPAGAVISHCWEITSYLHYFLQPFHFYAEFLFAALHCRVFFVCCFVLINSCSFPPLSGPPSTLEKNSLNQKRELYSPSVMHHCAHLSLEGCLVEVSLKIYKHVFLLFLLFSSNSKDSHPFPSHFLPFSGHCDSVCMNPSAEWWRGGEKSCCVFCHMEFSK